MSVAEDLDVTATNSFGGLARAVAATINLPLSASAPPLSVPVGMILSKIVFPVLKETDIDGANSKLLPRMHVDALKLLASVVASAGRRLLPFAVTLGELLGLCISRTGQTLLGRAHGVFESACSCSETCLQHLGDAVGMKLAEPPLLRHLLSEIDKHMQGWELLDQENDDSFAQSVGSGSRKRRKDRRNHHQQQLQGLANASSAPIVDSRLLEPCSVESSCHLAAAKLLRTIVRTSACILPVNMRLEIDRATVRWLTRYGDINCRRLSQVDPIRLCYFELLIFSLSHPAMAQRLPTRAEEKMRSTEASSSSVHDGPPLAPDLLPIARQLFAAGATEHDTNIASICLQGLRMCEIQAHGRARPMYFAPMGSYLVASTTCVNQCVPPQDTKSAEAAVAESERATDFGSGTGAFSANLPSEPPLLNEVQNQHLSAKEKAFDPFAAASLDGISAGMNPARAQTSSLRTTEAVSGATPEIDPGAVIHSEAAL
eukprot:SAG31_NODE_4992_length_2815_cov_1.867820_3_plen_486_part_01